ncbi:MAG: hypothetical protein ACE5HK_01925 [Candidatus Methylomirabilales bacterium]
MATPSKHFVRCRSCTVRFGPTEEPIPLGPGVAVCHDCYRRLQMWERLREWPTDPGERVAYEHFLAKRNTPVT